MRGGEKLYAIDVLCQMQSEKGCSQPSKSNDEKWQTGNEREMPNLRNSHV